MRKLLVVGSVDKYLNRAPSSGDFEFPEERAGLRTALLEGAGVLKSRRIEN